MKPTLAIATDLSPFTEEVRRYEGWTPLSPVKQIIGDKKIWVLPEESFVTNTHTPTMLRNEYDHVLGAILSSLNRRLLMSKPSTSTV